MSGSALRLSGFLACLGETLATLRNVVCFINPINHVAAWRSRYICVRTSRASRKRTLRVANMLHLGGAPSLVSRTRASIL